MKVGSLFAGIGGLELGLERAGMEVVWQVEIDDFCNRVLEKHWPNVKRYRDVRDVGKHNLEPVDLICGGFPCQDVSQAHTFKERPGVKDGRRSGLWIEYARLIGDLRPSWVVVENVEALRYAGRGFDIVLYDLAQLGYDAEWCIVPARVVGAPHKRARLWLVAHTNGDRESDCPVHAQASIMSDLRGALRPWPNPPRGLRVAHGIPNRVDRLRALGNAVVPQVAEWIGRRIMESENHKPQLIASTT